MRKRQTRHEVACVSSLLPPLLLGSMIFLSILGRHPQRLGMPCMLSRRLSTIGNELTTLLSRFHSSCISSRFSQSQFHVSVVGNHRNWFFHLHSTADALSILRFVVNTPVNVCLKGPRTSHGRLHWRTLEATLLLAPAHHPNKGVEALWRMNYNGLESGGLSLSPNVRISVSVLTL